MTNNATRHDEKYGIVRMPDSQGAIVMKLGNHCLVADELYNRSDLIFQSVSSNSALTDATIDRSGIDETSELAELMHENWGIPYDDFGN